MAWADARKPDGTPYTPTDLRTMQDWVLRPQMRTVPGVVGPPATTLKPFSPSFVVAMNPRSWIAALAQSFAQPLKAI